MVRNLRKSSVRFLLCCVIIVASNQAWSQQKDTLNLYNMSLEELMNVTVVSASKKAQKLMEAPAIMTVMGKSEIEQMGLTSLVDVLRFVPGIDISLAADGDYRISIRGNRKSGNVLFLLDGHQLNDFYTGKALTDLPISMIEKIEVVRGPGSSLFGTNAVAGVVNVFLTEGSFARVYGGLNGTFGTHLNHSWEKNEFKINLRAGYQQDQSGEGKIETDAGDKEGNSWDLTYDSLTYKTKRNSDDAYFNIDLENKGFRFYATSFLRTQSDWAGARLIVAPQSRYDVQQHLVGMDYEIVANEFIKIVPKIYGSFIKRNNCFQETPKGYFSNISGDIFTDGAQTKENYQANTYGAELDLYLKINERLNLLSGNVFEDLALKQYDISRNYQIVGDSYKQSFGNYDQVILSQKDKRRFVFAYFLQADYKLDKVNFTFGLRYDDYSDFGTSFNPRLGVNWQMRPNWRLKGLYGKAFRAPTFEELYDNSTIGNEYGVLGNQNLKPESIQTFELATEYQKKNYLIQYNAYYNVNQNLIRVYDPHGGGSIGLYENIGSTNTIGHELEWRIDLNKHVALHGDLSQYLMLFTLNDSVISQADQVFFDNQHKYYHQMLNQPRIRANIYLSLAWGKMRLFVGANYGGKASNNSRFYLEKGSFVEIPAWIQGNMMLSYELGKKWQIRLNVNKLGKRYVDPEESTNIDAYGTNGLIQPGPSGILGITYKIP